MKRKSSAIAHSIVAATRPRSFQSPIHFGVTIHLQRKFGSRVLIDLLANLGHCAPYAEALKFERAASVEDGLHINKGYLQFIFDNVDYNINSIDGHNTFHAIKGIIFISPGSEIDQIN